MTQTEPNMLARALELAERKNHDMGIQTGSLLAEVGMLREALQRSDTDRIRLQAVSSTLLGRLLAINAVIADAVAAARRNGIEAVEAAPDEELEKAASEVAEVLRRVEPVASTPEPAAPNPSPAPPKAAVGGPMPPVDWTRLPQGQAEPYQFRNGR